jgi:hypothetical protein
MPAAPGPEEPSKPSGPNGPRFGWRAEQRPRPGFTHALGAVAGVFAVVAVAAFVAEAGGDDPVAPGVGFTLLLIAAALVVGAKAPGPAPGPLRAASTTVLVLAVPLLWFFAFSGSDTFGRGEFRGILLLTTGCYLLLYLAGWTRGRGVFLAGTLLVLTTWITFEISGDSGAQLVPFQAQISSSTDSSFGTSTGLDSSADSSSAAAAATMLLGLLYLAVGASYDRKRWAGLATPFVAVGAYATITGTVGLDPDGSRLTVGILAIVAGAIVGLVGSRGDNRRATTWIGALTVLGGMVAVITDIAPDSAAGLGGIATGFAVVLGAVAVLLAPRLGEPDDGAPRPAPGDPGAPTPVLASGEGA